MPEDFNSKQEDGQRPEDAEANRLAIEKVDALFASAPAPKAKGVLWSSFTNLALNSVKNEVERFKESPNVKGLGTLLREGVTELRERASAATLKQVQPQFDALVREYQDKISTSHGSDQIRLKRELKAIGERWNTLKGRIEEDIASVTPFKI